ncbi:thermonuclease family protein [Pseudonocardia lutea]|uniref:Thermonuclease family protein n=1 Tax=Pseudonocardia lutea TaxID=2172015 RepID=A0ABW1I7V0_9PSEU
MIEAFRRDLIVVCPSLTSNGLLAMQEQPSSTRSPGAFLFGLLVKAAFGVAVVGGGATAVAVATATPDADAGIVADIIDGDTVDVRVEGDVRRVRLLNIDTPETVDPDEDVQCLGPEASAYLGELIPVGTEVTLRYDNERTDAYGRTLAAVFADDNFVNAEMARAGLAAAVVYGENDDYLPDVQEAQQEAQEAGRGLYSPDIACTVPARAARVEAAAASVPSAQMAGAPAQLEAALARADSAVTEASSFLRWASGSRRGLVWRALDQSTQDRLVERVAVALARARDDRATLRVSVVTARTEEKIQAGLARLRAAAEDQPSTRTPAGQTASSPSASELPSSNGAHTPRADSSSTSASSRGDGRSASSGTGTSEGVTSSSSSAGHSYPGYTGPRCYAPGGKTWKPC